MTISIDPNDWEAGKRALEQAIWLYLKNPAVSLIDLGFRIQNADKCPIEPVLMVRIHLQPQRSAAAGKDNTSQQLRYMIDAQQIGFAGEVIYASYILNFQLNSSNNCFDSFDWCGGMCLANPATGLSGTFGGVVQDRKTGEELLLGSWHVLADSWNAGQHIGISKHPNCSDDSKSNVAIKTIRHAIASNLDAAVAQVYERGSFKNEQLGIGAVTGVAVPRLGMRVIKSGAGSGITSGIITGLLGYTIQNYDGKKWIIGPTIHISSESPTQKLCATGDSGAWWLEQHTHRAVALHFAGSSDSRFGLALAMSDVLEALNIQIVPGQTEPAFLAQNSIALQDEKIKLLPANSIQSGGTGEAVVAAEIQCDFKFLAENASNFLDPSHLKKSLKQLDIKLIFKKFSTVLNQDTGKILYKFAQLSFLILLWIMILKYSYYQPQRHQCYQAELDHLKNSLSQITAISQIDQERNFTVKKIIAIINQHNPDMAVDLKFRIAREIYEMSIKYSNLDLELICATITHESALTWDPAIVSPANAMGLMQIMPATGIFLAKEEGLEPRPIQAILSDPVLNIRLGCRYLSALIEAYNIDGGLAAYNGGMKRAEAWVRNGRARGILPTETDNYIPSILKIYKEYRRM